MDIKIFCYIFNLLLATLLVNGTPVPTGQGGKLVLCYFKATSAMLPQPEVRFIPEDIDLTICTHVVYNRAIVGSDLKVAPKDSEVDLQENDGLGLFHRTVALKERKPGLKVIVALQDINAVLADVAVYSNHESLSAFARNVADFVENNGFDGVDFSVDNHEEMAVDEFKSDGIPTERLVVPIPAFSVSWKICNAEENGLNSTICGFGTDGLYESSPMVLYSSELLRKISNSTEGWVVRRDPESKVSYGYSKTLQWVSFEDPESVRAKAAVILERNLAGAAIIEVNMEDFKGAYTENGETYPLTRAAYNSLNGES